MTLPGRRGPRGSAIMRGHGQPRHRLTGHPLLRPPARPGRPLLHRDVGALRLLRHARPAHPLPHGGGSGRGNGLLRRGGRLHLRPVHVHGVPLRAARGLDRRPRHRAAAGGAGRGDPDRRRLPVDGGAGQRRLLRRPRPGGGGHRASQDQHQRDRRPALLAERRAPRRRLLPLLHGHQPRRSARAPGLQLPRREGRLAPRVRLRRRGHDAGPDHLSRLREHPRRGRAAPLASRHPGGQGRPASARCGAPWPSSPASARWSPA